MRRDILLGYIAVLDQPGKLIDVCAAVSGDVDDVRLAVEQAFDLGPVAADAVLSMQIRRFTPRERHRIVDELAELDAQLR